MHHRRDAGFLAPWRLGHSLQPTSQAILDGGAVAFAHDAFLVWNFFDAALQRKEYFSGYVFEDLAADMLAQDEGLRAAYAAMQREHPEWEDRPREALMWLYSQSEHDEGTAYRLPVFQGR